MEFIFHHSTSHLAGLDKLASTQVEVQEMQTILTGMKPELEKASAATAAMIKRITADTVKI